MNEPTIQDLKKEVDQLRFALSDLASRLREEVRMRTSMLTAVVWIEALLIGFLLARELL